MIWRNYLSNPRVIALEVVRENWQSRKVLYGECSWLHHVNREARQEALRVQELYSPNVEDEPQWYINLDLDVVWLIHSPLDGLRLCPWRHGPRYFDASLLIRGPPPKWQGPMPEGLSPWQIPRLAVAWEWWHTESLAIYPALNQFAWEMKGFHDNGVVELLLVINSYMALSKNKRIVFKEPSQSPQHAFTVETPRLSDSLERGATWEELGNEAKRIMDDKRIKYVDTNEELRRCRLKST